MKLHSCLLIKCLLLLPLLSCHASDSPASLLSLKDSSVKINAPKDAKIEQTPTGGIRVTYTNATELEEAPVMDITKLFDPPVSAKAITFQWQAEEQVILVHVWNDEDKVAYQHYPPTLDYTVETKDLRYKEDLEPFAGKVRRIMVGTTLEKTQGDHVVQFEGLKVE